MKIRVGLFFGGKSVEHEVSVISAAQTAAAMDMEKYQVIPIYITKDNEMYTGDSLFTPAHYRDMGSLLARSQRVALIRDKGKVYVMRYPAKLFVKPLLSQLDLAFPVIHGTNGEDGSLQGFFQLHGLPYVGSGVGASSCGMDKWAAKCLLHSAGLPVLPGHCFQSMDYYEEPDRVIRELEGFHEYPLIVKPVNLGSSVGIGAAHGREELRDCIELAASFSERILIEPLLLFAREINCAVLGDDDRTEASACEEPLSTGEILSYRDKYQGGGYRGKAALAEPAGYAQSAGHTPSARKSSAKGMESAMRKLPAELEKETEDKIKALARQAFQALHCNGVARVDFLYDQAGGRVYINELNTIPGSLSFYLWEAEGKPFRQLTEELIQLALKRNRIQERIIWSNEVNLLSGAAQGIKGLKG